MFRKIGGWGRNMNRSSTHDRLTRQPQSDQIVLELRPDGSYAINTQPVAFEQLDAKFHEFYDQRPAKLLFIKAAPNRKYGDIVRAMDIARGAGVQVIGFTPAQPGTAAPAP